MLEINNTTGEKVNAKKLRAIAGKFSCAYKQSDDVSLALVGPDRMKSLNRQYRGIDKATDVLSFTKEREIVINIADAKKFEKYQEMFLEPGMNIRTASKVTSKDATGAAGKKTVTGATGAARKKRLSEYLLYFLFVHGLLHLAGYDDKTETGRREMIKRGRDFLKKIGLRYPQIDF
ncbi:MAG: rRNA maturation RNAse YbeY [Candidatus Falkowbacteria bacterium]|nr:rRNA maturation RNAse YbeY [Candidatus Falkowbacteria bacterium]